MAYMKQEFINYMHKKGNGQPGGYCNGLDNVEKLFSVDIDKEYDKDIPINKRLTNDMLL